MNKILMTMCALALVAAACGDGDDETTAETTTTTTTEAPATTTTAAPTTTSTTTTTTTTTTTEAPLAWRQVIAGDDCFCSDGSEYSYWVREGDPSKVMLFFDGGGACFSAESCDPSGSPTYSIAADDDLNQSTNGVFDLDNPENPVGDWTMIFMPYCTGDVHIGTNAAQDYGDGIVVNHTGYLNATKGFDEVVANYADADQVLVTGSSAGGVPVPLFAGLLADALPEAEILGLPDASGGYPSTPLVNTVIGGLWGTEGAVPDWSTTEGIGAAEMGIPDLYRYAGLEFPDIRWARFDHAFDGVQSSFSALAGLEDSSVKAVLDINEGLTEDAGIDLPVYVAPGTEHTIMGRAEMYDLEVEGVRYVDWLTDFIAGEAIGDVVCTECGDPS
ncbi:MAG: pectin acetylesterase-family hydrolase [Actinomycetota bacterium]